MLVSALITVGLTHLLAPQAQQTDSQKVQKAMKAMSELPGLPEPSGSAASVPDGYTVEVFASDLTYPTSVEFGETGVVYVAEGGFSYGDEVAPARIWKFAADGSRSLVAADLQGPITDLLWHDGKLFVSQRGKVSSIYGTSVTDLVTDLPSYGDHHNNQLTVGPDGKIYFGVGTPTNSGVVGMDNAMMGWLPKHPEFHDRPWKDIELVNNAYTTPNPLTPKKAETVRTSAFMPFGKTGTRVKGSNRPTGAIYRVDADGKNLEVYAWGFRNPVGLFWHEGKLYCTENGFDIRGSRPIANDLEDLYEVKQGAWYGYPDYGSGIPITDPRFAPKDGPKPQFLMKNHPPVEKPLMTFAKHSAIMKIDVSPGGSFAPKGNLFVAFFGHMTPMTGEAPKEHGGHRVVSIDPATWKSETFFSKKEEGHGGHGGHGEKIIDTEDFHPGPKRLVDVRFSPDGNSLYVADFGALVILPTAQGPTARPFPNSGVIWKITRSR